MKKTSPKQQRRSRILTTGIDSLPGLVRWNGRVRRFEAGERPLIMRAVEAEKAEAIRAQMYKERRKAADLARQRERS